MEYSTAQCSTVQLSTAHEGRFRNPENSSLPLFVPRNDICTDCALVTLSLIMLFRSLSILKDTVRTEFEGVTVLSIAHRLHTIAFFDKVLVMDKGSAAEFDSPLALMDCEGSIFRSMCDRSGDGDFLRRVATGKSKEEEAKKALCVADDELREAAEATSADV